MPPSIEARFCINKGDFTLDSRFQIPAVGVTALFGPSGCGKTTLLRAIAGREQDRQGYLKVGDSHWQQQGQSLPPHQRPLGYVFQESSLFEHLNVRANVEYGYNRVKQSEHRVSLDQAIQLLGIGHLLERYPGSLSGGERQRVAIARAVAVSPRLLLMDEPLAALDHSRKQEVLPFIQSLHKQLEIPVLYVSHSLDEVAQIADHLILMQQGKVLGSGAIDEMFTRLDLPLAHELDASAILHAEVTGFDEAYQLTYLQFAAGTMTVSGQGLKRGDQLRLRLVARDVSLTLQRQTETSILNIFPATVDEILQLNPSQMTVRLLAGGMPMLSRITRKSAAELGLKTGMSVFAQVKSVALLP
jgi:molybdate transport system ATP-binding protein